RHVGDCEVALDRAMRRMANDRVGQIDAAVELPSDDRQVGDVGRVVAGRIDDDIEIPADATETRGDVDVALAVGAHRAAAQARDQDLKIRRAQRCPDRGKPQERRGGLSQDYSRGVGGKRDALADLVQRDVRRAATSGLLAALTISAVAIVAITISAVIRVTGGRKYEARQGES